MDMFQVYFATSNAAFEEDRNGSIARILREIANRITDGDHEGIVRDLNGNPIGEFSLTE